MPFDEARNGHLPPAEAHRRFLRTPRFASLDGLRTLCIAAVLWHHAPLVGEAAARWTVLGRGFLGVDFFFVLSGFLITTLLLREARQDGRFSLRGFYWRRALRILPPYLLVVTAVSVYYVAVKGEWRYLEFVPFYYLFLANFLQGDLPLLSPTWSLSVEEQFYMVWPLLMLALPRRALGPALAAGVALNLAAVTGALRPLGIVPFELGVLRFEMFTATYAPLLVGAALALGLDGRRSHAALASVLGRRGAPFAAFALLAALLVLLPRDVEGWPGLALHLAMALTLGTLVAREDHALRPVLAWAPIRRVGEISYGIYLYHLVALHVVVAGLARLGWHDAAAGWGWAVLALYTGVSILMAEASFRLLEGPCLALRHRRRPPGRVPAT